MALFDAYHVWLGIPPDEQPADYYRLLGIPKFEADTEVVSNAADQRMAFIRKFQSGPHAHDAARILNELAAARVCLLKEDRKATYDAQLTTRRFEPAQNIAAPVMFPAVARPILAPSSLETLTNLNVEGADLPAAPATPGNPITTTFDAIDVASLGRPHLAPPEMAAIPTIRTSIGRKPPKHSWISAVFFLSSPVVGLSLGYLILCMLGPQYDFLNLFSNHSEPAFQTPVSPPKVAKSTETTTPAPTPRIKQEAESASELNADFHNILRLLANRNTEGARLLLLDVRTRRMQHPQKEEFNRVNRAYFLVRAFWQEHQRQIHALSPGTELSIDGETLIVENVLPKELQVRYRGAMVTFQRDSLPLQLAEAMTARKTTRGAPEHALKLGILHAVDAWGDRKKVAHYLQTAMRAGLWSSNDVTWAQRLSLPQQAVVWPPVVPIVEKPEPVVVLPFDPVPEVPQVLALPAAFELPPLAMGKPVVVCQFAKNHHLKLKSFSDSVVHQELVERAPKEGVREWDVFTRPIPTGKLPAAKNPSSPSPIARFRADNEKLMFVWMTVDPTTRAGSLRNAQLSFHGEAVEHYMKLRSPPPSEAIQLELTKPIQQIELPVVDVPSHEILYWQLSKCEALIEFEQAELGLIPLSKRNFLTLQAAKECKIECAASRREDRIVISFKPVARIGDRPAFSWTADGMQEEYRSLNTSYMTAERELAECRSKLSNAQSLLSSALSRTLPADHPARGLAAQQQNADVAKARRAIDANRRRVRSLAIGLKTIKDKATQLESIQALHGQINNARIHLKVEARSNGDTVTIARCGLNNP